MSYSIQEQGLIDILKDTIGISHINVRDKFKDLGGDSMTILVVLMEIERKFGVSLEIELFFQQETSTVEALANEIAKQQLVVKHINRMKNL